MNRSLCALATLTLAITAGAQPPPANPATDDALRRAAEALDFAEGDVTTLLPRMRLWCDLAVVRHRRGDRDGAEAALRKVRDVIDSPRRPGVELARQLGTTLGQMGDSKAVLALAEGVPEQMENRRDNPRQTILQEAAFAAAAAGHGKAAGEIAAALTGEAARRWVLARVRSAEVVRRVKGGDAAGALRAAGELPTAEEKVHILVGPPEPISYSDHPPTDGIAPAQLQGGDKVGATATALQALALVPDVAPARRAQAATAVSRMLAHLDDVPAARKALALIPPGGQTLAAAGYVAAAEARAGRDAAAAAFVGGYTQPGEKGYLLYTIALAQGRVGRKEAARANFARAVDLIAEDKSGLTSPHNVASAQAEAGDFEGAERTARPLTESPITWSNIAYSRARAGDFAGARRTAETIAEHDRFWGGMAFRGVARAQAAAGQAAAVRDWARRIEDHMVRAHAMLGLAEGATPAVVGR